MEDYSFDQSTEPEGYIYASHELLLRCPATCIISAGLIQCTVVLILHYWIVE